MISNRRIMADPNGKVVTEENPAVTYRLVVAAGGEISDADMKKYGLTAADLGSAEPVESAARLGVVAAGGEISDAPKGVMVVEPPEDKTLTPGKPKK